MEAQDIAAKLECCGPPLEHIEHIGLVCPACGTIKLEEANLPDIPVGTEVQVGGMTFTKHSDVETAWEQMGRGKQVAVPSSSDPITTNLPTIDQTEIHTPDGIAGRIADCNARLERGMSFHRACIEEKYAADLAYEMAYARAIQQAAERGGASDVRRANATLACEQEFTRKHVAELKLKAVAATTHDLRAMLSGYQTMLRAVQATYDSAGQAERHTSRKVF